MSVDLNLLNEYIMEKNMIEELLCKAQDNVNTLILKKRELECKINELAMLTLDQFKVSISDELACFLGKEKDAVYIVYEIAYLIRKYIDDNNLVNEDVITPDKNLIELFKVPDNSLLTTTNISAYLSNHLVALYDKDNNIID
jgi:chromatin remodeling complex protein RSC6